LRWWSLLCVGGFLLLAFVACAWPLAITWMLLCSGLPTLTMQAVVFRRERLIEDQLVTVARSLSNAVRAGLSIPQGLTGILTEASQPLQGILTEVVYQYERGRPLRDALDECRCRLKLEPFTLFCLALEVSLERGGRVNRSLEQLAGSLQEWQRIRRKLDSETASGRFAVLLLSGCPLLFGFMFWCCGIAEVRDFFTEFGGQIVLSLVLLLIWSGNRWTSRIMKFSLS
jgi:tight adherence protein B